MLIAQITDTHVLEPGELAFGLIDTGARLAACVARLNALEMPPDIVVATGDLVDSGSEQEYRQLRRLLSPLKAPVYAIPGNHDCRANLRKVFGGDGYFPDQGPFLQYTIEDYPVRIVAMDTVVEGEPGGIVDEPRLDWLAARLIEGRTRPTIIIMHHPPFATGITHMDGMNCANADALARLIERNPQVERILCGHVHRAIQARFAGTVAMIGPSAAFQVALDFAAGAPARWTDEPPGFSLHFWRKETGLTSHICYVADPGPKRPFRNMD